MMNPAPSLDQSPASSALSVLETEIAQVFVGKQEIVRRALGAFPLPESQLDRFLMRLSIGYPDSESEKNILRQNIDMDAVRHLQARLTQAEILALMDRVPKIQVAQQVDDYILALVQATRTLPR